MRRYALLSIALTALVWGAAAQSSLLPPQPAVALNVWLSAGAPEDDEPIVSPHQIGKIIRTCSAKDAGGRCSEERLDLLALARSLERRPESIWKVADCLTTGCDGAMPVARRNACLWWTATSDLFPANATGYGRDLEKFTCGRAGWTAIEKDAVYAEWKRAFLAGQ